MKYLSQVDFSPAPPVIIQKPSILDPFKPIIQQWLEDDKKHWCKQHHTAQRVYDRLVQKHCYTGSYIMVQRYLKTCRSLQVDFGEADFYENWKLCRKKHLTVSFPYSNDGYSQVFGSEIAECVCQGIYSSGNRLKRTAKHKVLVGIWAHTVDILTHGGQLLTSHRQMFGEGRTDISDYSATLAMLMKHAGAWHESGLRRETADILRTYMDEQSKEKLEDYLKIPNDLTNQYGFHAAASAMEMAAARGKGQPL